MLNFLKFEYLNSKWISYGNKINLLSYIILCMIIYNVVKRAELLRMGQAGLLVLWAQARPWECTVVDTNSKTLSYIQARTHGIASIFIVFTIFWGIVLYIGVVQCGVVQCGVVQCGAVQCGAVKCGVVKWSVVWSSVVWSSVVLCDVVCDRIASNCELRWTPCFRSDQF